MANRACIETQASQARQPKLSIATPVRPVMLFVDQRAWHIAPVV